MSALQLADLIDVGLSPWQIGRLLFLRWRIQRGQLSEGVPSVGVLPSAECEYDVTEAVRSYVTNPLRREGRMGYRKGDTGDEAR